MAVTIALNIPDDVYACLKEAAQANRRSIKREVIVCLEKALLSARMASEARLARARKLRSSLVGTFEAEEILAAIAPLPNI